MRRPSLYTSRSNCQTDEHITPVFSDCSSLSWKKKYYRDELFILAVFGLVLYTSSQCALDTFIFLSCKMIFPSPQVWRYRSVRLLLTLFRTALIYTEAMNTFLSRIAAVYIIWLLHTWWGNFPPWLIVAIKHTSVKYTHYCISVYT